VLACSSDDWLDDFLPASLVRPQLNAEIAEYTNAARFFFIFFLLADVAFTIFT